MHPHTPDKAPNVKEKQFEYVNDEIDILTELSGQHSEDKNVKAHHSSRWGMKGKFGSQHVTSRKSSTFVTN